MSDVIMKFARAVESGSLARKIRMMPSYIFISNSHLQIVIRENCFIENIFYDSSAS
jgi:hypothetical protein